MTPEKRGESGKQFWFIFIIEQYSTHKYTTILCISIHTIPLSLPLIYLSIYQSYVAVGKDDSCICDRAYTCTAIVYVYYIQHDTFSIHIYSYIHKYMSYAVFLNTTTPLCPPKPKLSEITTLRSIFSSAYITCI